LPKKPLTRSFLIRSSQSISFW